MASSRALLTNRRKPRNQKCVASASPVSSSPRSIDQRPFWGDCRADVEAGFLAGGFAAGVFVAGRFAAGFCPVVAFAAGFFVGVVTGPGTASGTLGSRRPTP